jgi:GNAT superfamily N-acetyltransferase
VSIWEARTDEQIKACYPVMRQLRPQFFIDSFLARVRFQQELGYHLVCLEDAGAPVVVAGFQVRETLIDGRFLHIDDFVTDGVQRSRGHGAELLRWLRQRAQELGCQSLQLDSGVSRDGAHRFYERQGLSRSAFHFAVGTRNADSDPLGPSFVQQVPG